MRSVAEKEAQLGVERAKYEQMLKESEARNNEVVEKQKELAKLQKKKSDLREKSCRTS